MDRSRFLGSVMRIGITLTALGLIIALINGYVYLARVCECPVEIAGRPPVPCCVDVPILLNVEIGVVVAGIGAATYVYGRIKLRKGRTP